MGNCNNLMKGQNSYKTPAHKLQNMFSFYFIGWWWVFSKNLPGQRDTKIVVCPKLFKSFPAVIWLSQLTNNKKNAVIFEKEKWAQIAQFSKKNCSKVHNGKKKSPHPKRSSKAVDPGNGQLQQSHHSGKIFEKRKSPNSPNAIFTVSNKIWAIIIETPRKWVCKANLGWVVSQ